MRKALPTISVTFAQSFVAKTSFGTNCEPIPTAVVPAPNHSFRLSSVGETPPVTIICASGIGPLLRALTNPAPKTSPGKIYNARVAGAEFIKIFPGDVLGAGFVKALKGGPMPDVQIMVTGGVSPTEESLKLWFGAGTTAVGIGSQLVPKDVLAAKDWVKVTNIVGNALNIIKGLK